MSQIIPTNATSVASTRTSLHTRDVLAAAKAIGEAMSKSKMFGIQNADQGLICAMTCIAENMTPLEFMRTYHIIQGRPTMRSDAMLARFQSAGGKHKIKTYTDTAVVIDFTWNGDTTEWSFTKDDADTAGLSGGNWNKYPKAMLFARCVSSGLKAICPALFHGLYVPEELETTLSHEEAPTAAGPVTTRPDNGNGANSSPIVPDPPKDITEARWLSSLNIGKKENGEPEWTIKKGDLLIETPRQYLREALKICKTDKWKEAIEEAIKHRTEKKLARVNGITDYKRALDVLDQNAGTMVLAYTENNEEKLHDIDKEQRDHLFLKLNRELLPRLIADLDDEDMTKIISIESRRWEEPEEIRKDWISYVKAIERHRTSKNAEANAKTVKGGQLQ